MTTLRSRSWFLFAIFFPLLAALACSTLAGVLPGASGQSEVTAQENKTFGSGPFTLSDPKVGLSDLTSYAATLMLSFDGTDNGAPSKWTRKYVMLASKEPAQRQLTVETTGIPNAESVLMAESDGADYQVSGKNDCTASAIEPGNSLSDQLEPAKFLHYVIGADEAGNETVNAVAANHYKFDERALGQQSPTQSTGEVWVASNGGYVLKYLLTTNAKADYFGDGIEGTMTWDYELTNVGKPISIQLPNSCPGGMVQAPLLDGASNVIDRPGVLDYDTSTSLADVAAFYQKQIPLLGWKLQGQVDATPAQALMDYRQGTQDMSIFIIANGSLTSVNIILERVPKQ